MAAVFILALGIIAALTQVGIATTVTTPVLIAVLATVAALAGYAQGVRAAALEHGWEPPADLTDWSEPDWLLTRLLAVCALARSLDPRYLA
nr:DUF6401 family natural product biosynthesis protein [Micromonospora globispora]